MKGFITTAVVTGLAMLGAAGAHANVSPEKPAQGDQPSSGGGNGCEWPLWTKQPRIVIHTSQFERGGAKPGEEADMVNAIEQVADQFSDTPDLSARITSVTTTTDPYYYDTWVNDSVPTIHVRFSPQSAITEDNDGDPAGGLTKTNTDWARCTISEAHIEFPQPSDKSWNYGTPNEAGTRWYDTAPELDHATWFRPSFLHELLHAFGFKHTASEYSFMNHRSPGGFPWAGGGDDGVRMLPWELGTLRWAYGDQGTSYDVGLRNTWYAAPQPGDDAGSQVALCPSPSAWDEAKNACTTEESGNRLVCKGDRTQGFAAVANSSTTRVEATLRLYFSEDETWDPDDLPSPTTYTDTLLGETSKKLGGGWTVPALLGGKPYFAIARVEAVPLDSAGNEDASQTRHESIPLRIPRGKDGHDRNFRWAGVATCGLEGSATDSTPVDTGSFEPWGG